MHVHKTTIIPLITHSYLTNYIASIHCIHVLDFIHHITRVWSFSYHCRVLCNVELRQCVSTIGFVLLAQPENSQLWGVNHHGYNWLKPDYSVSSSLKCTLLWMQ